MADENPTGWLLGGGGLVALGGGLKWLWDRIAHARASRERKIEAREDEYVTKLEERLTRIEKELGDNRLAIALLVADVARRDPGSPVLFQVQQILGAAFPLHVGLPQDMQASLDRLHDVKVSR